MRPTAGRLRQASRASVGGVRDFLRTLKRAGTPASFEASTSTEGRNRPSSSNALDTSSTNPSHDEEPRRTVSDPVRSPSPSKHATGGFMYDSDDDDWDRSSSSPSRSPDVRTSPPPTDFNSNATISNRWPSPPRLLAADGPARARTYSTNSVATAHRMPWSAGAQLVLTTDAMPTLLAYLGEVRDRCQTCLLELRGATV